MADQTRSRIPYALLCSVALCYCGGEEFSSDDDAGGGGNTPAATCEDVCATRAELHCTGETSAKCQSDCTFYESLVRWCDAQADAALACLAAEPSSSFECSADKALGIRDGICTETQDALLGCWYEGPAGGLPPEVKEECAEMCKTVSSLPCSSETCESDCRANLEPTKSCDGIYGAWLDCAVAQPASAWQCSLEAKPELKEGACAEYVFVLIACLSSG